MMRRVLDHIKSQLETSHLPHVEAAYRPRPIPVRKPGGFLQRGAIFCHQNAQPAAGVYIPLPQFKRIRKKLAAG